MYFRTEDGLGQDQATWSTPQTFNRPTAQPTPIGYLGRFHEPTAKREQSWGVWGFEPGRARLLQFQKKHINDIVTSLFKLLRDDLAGKGKAAGIRLYLWFEGHVDKNTDPAQYGSLDRGRANAVELEFLNRMDKLNPGVYPIKSSSKVTLAGSTRPYPGSDQDPKLNRRVKIGVRWEIESPFYR